MTATESIIIVLFNGCPGLTDHLHFHGSRRTGVLPSSSFECVSHYGCSVRTEELSLFTTALFILPSFICKPLPICIRGESTLCIPLVSFRIDSLELADVKVEPCACLFVHLSVLADTCDKALRRWRKWHINILCLAAQVLGEGLPGTGTGW